ncbi:MAG: endonuclease/exonuclease/phosphatase family protein [Candidatus Azobacteroides sp.]|nr:endonuclease/exonuclease/phosphatase family protein [Candidatus Azobacteroides sp.]
MCLLLSAFSGYISPYRFVLPSYLGLFFPFIFIGNIAVFLAWLFFKQWKQALLHLVVFCICGGAVYTYCPLHKQTEKIPEDAIKILTYNVMRFNNLSKNDPGDPPNKIIQYIIENDADIVCIQEFGASKSNTTLLTEDNIKNAMEKYPYYYAYPLQFPYKSQDFGLAIFSRFPILSMQKVPYESAYNGSFITELDIRGKRVTLINNHLESNKLSREERSNYYQLTKEPDTQSLDAFTQTMTKRLTPAFKARAGQAQIISQIIKENENPYIIVCGDFNDTPISYARHKIKGNLRDAFVDSGFGLGITYNKYRFLFRIDYILHSKNIQSYNCTVGKLKSSDHYPLWCYLQFKD